MFVLNEPIQFYDFSAEKTSNYCGFGLKNLLNIKKNDEILVMSTEMGIHSNVFLDEEELKTNNKEFMDQIVSYTDQVTKLYFPHEVQKVQ